MCWHWLVMLAVHASPWEVCGRGDPVSSSFLQHPSLLLAARGRGWSRACAGGQTVITASLPGTEHAVLAMLLALVPSCCDLEEVALVSDRDRAVYLGVKPLVRASNLVSTLH